MKKKSIFIFWVCYLAYASTYIARVNLTMASPGMMELSMLSASQLGLMGSLFSVIYACGRLYFGSLSDCTPPYKVICTGLTLCGVCNLLVSFFPPFPGLLFLWSMNALAQSMLWSSVICVLPGIFDERTVAKVTPILITSSSFGQIVGILVTAWLIENIALGWAFIVPGFLTLIAAGFILALTRKIPAQADAKAAEHKNLFAIIKNHDVQALILPSAFHGAIKDNISLWMAVFLLDKYGVNIEKSAAYVLLIPAAGLLIRFTYNGFYKLCRERELVVAYLTFAVCGVASTLLFIESLPILAAVLALCSIFAAVSLINVSVIGMFPLRFAHSGNTGSVSGIIDFCSYLGSGVFSALYGSLVDSYGFFPMFFSWVLFSVISFFILYRLQKKFSTQESAA